MIHRGFDESGYCNSCGTHYENVDHGGCSTCRFFKRNLETVTKGEEEGET